MQLTPMTGASWMVPLSFLCSLEVGARQVPCGSEEFLQSGTTCRPCPQCPDGEHLSAVCGHGLGAEAECVPCPADQYSNADTGHQCWSCATACSLLHKVQERSCTPSHDRVCGRCLEGYFQFAGLHCHLCSIEPINPYCKDWLAQQTTTQQSTVIPWETSSSTDIKHEPVTKSSGQHYIDWLPGTISGIVLAVISLVIAAVCIAKNGGCILRCCLGTHENSMGEELEKKTAPPGNGGARCSADLKKKALEATADKKLEDLKQDQRDDLAMQLNPEPSAPGDYKNWRHFACHFKIDKTHINNWRGMINVLDYLENSTHVTIPDIIEAIDSIGRVKVLERFCHSLLNEESMDCDNV